MSGTWRRFAVAGLAAAVFVGIFLHAGTTEAQPRPDSPVAVAEWSPAGVMPAAVRARAWAEGELLSLADLHRGRLLGLAPAGLLGGLGLAALAWWRLAEADRRPHVRPARARLPALRAPPAAGSA